MAWYWIMRYRNYRGHPLGVTRYSEKAAALVASDGLEALKSAQRGIEARLASCKGAARVVRQKWNKLRDLGRPGEPFATPVLPEEYEAVRSRYFREGWVLLAAIAGEMYLNYLALMIIIGGRDPLVAVARWMIALLMTIAAFKVFHKMLEAWMPPGDVSEEDRRHRILVRGATTALGILVLVATAAISVARARDFEGGEAGIGIVGGGFILLSLILPIVGGMVDFDRDRHLPAYRRLRKWRRALKDLRSHEAALQDELTRIEEAIEHVKTQLHEDAVRMFAGVTDFRVSKERNDAKSNRQLEDLSGTPAESAHAFVEACMSLLRPRLGEFLAEIEAEREEVLSLARRAIEPAGSSETPAAAQGVTPVAEVSRA